MFGKDNLFADPTDFSTSDKVISFLRSAGGVNITATTVGAKEALDVFVANDSSNPIAAKVASFLSLLAGAVTVGTTAVALPATALTGRRNIQVQNNGTKPIYIGASGVTTATGIKVSPGSVWEETLDETCLVYAISATAGQDVRVVEFA